jgi:hypothetical protein
LIGAIQSSAGKESGLTFAGRQPDTGPKPTAFIEERRKAIDVAIWPMSFNNRRLSSKVDCARHALSLDDERMTFHPLRFDRSTEADVSRIKEVWFAGVHSDVGGGYPDYELALVPCVWMAESEPTTSVSGGRNRGASRQSSSLGPRHDSGAACSIGMRLVRWKRPGSRGIRSFTIRQPSAWSSGPTITHH